MGPLSSGLYRVQLTDDKPLSGYYITREWLVTGGTRLYSIDLGSPNLVHTASVAMFRLNNTPSIPRQCLHKNQPLGRKNSSTCKHCFGTEGVIKMDQEKN